MPGTTSPAAAPNGAATSTKGAPAAGPESSITEDIESSSAEGAGEDSGPSYVVTEGPPENGLGKASQRPKKGATADTAVAVKGEGGGKIEPEGKAEGKAEAKGDGEGGEPSDEVKAEGGEPSDEVKAEGGENEDETKKGPPDEAQLKRRFRRLEKAFADLTDKKRAFREHRENEYAKIGQAAKANEATQAQLAQDRQTFEREHAEVKKWVGEEAETFKFAERVQKLAGQNSHELAAALEAHGFDIDKFVKNYVAAYGPQGAEHRTSAEIAEVRKQLEAERKAREELEAKRKADEDTRSKAEQERQEKAEKEARDREIAERVHRESVAFISFAKDSVENYPLAAVAAEENPEEVARLAWKVYAEHKEVFDRKGKGKAEAILAEVEDYYDDQIKKAEARKAKVASRRQAPSEQRQPAAQGVAAKDASTGLPSQQRRAPAASSKPLEDLTDEERTKLAVQRVRQQLRA